MHVYVNVMAMNGNKFTNPDARRGGAEVAGWTLDRKIRVRFPAYPHCVWAL